MVLVFPNQVSRFQKVRICSTADVDHCFQAYISLILFVGLRLISGNEEVSAELLQGWTGAELL